MKFYTLPLLLSLSPFLGSTVQSAQENCVDMLSHNSAPRTRTEQDAFVYLYSEMSPFQNSQDFFEGLSPEITSTRVRFHRSRSPNKATAEFPRTIFIDEKDPDLTVVYAFSLRPAQDPIVEIQSYDKQLRETTMFEATWNADGKMSLKANPQKCLACHSGTRPLIESIPSRNFRPFAFLEDHDNSRALEIKLTQLNNDIQFKYLADKKFKKSYINLLNSALNDSDEVFQIKFNREKSNYSYSEIYEWYLSQRSLFYQILTYKPEPGTPFLAESDHRNIRILQAMQLMDLAEFLELLSLNVRPSNYELSNDSLERLQAWVDKQGVTQSQNDTWSWWPF